MTASAINGHRESDQQRNSFKVDTGDIFQRGGGVRNYELSWAPWYHLELKPTQPRHGRLLSNMHATVYRYYVSPSIMNALRVAL